MTPSLTRRAAGIVVGLAAMVVIVAVTVAVFFNPVYVAFEQDRAQAAAWTGYTPEDVHAVTNSVLGQLYFGPATFDQAVIGQTVFDARERAHLADVRGVLLGLGLATFIALLALIAGAVASRRADWYWRAIRRAAGVLAAAIVIGGIVFALAFDAAFDLFHRLFFAGGSYTFDPYTERLVQLFPERFWSETSIAIAVVGLLLSIAVWLGAGRRTGGTRTRRIPEPSSSTAGLPARVEDAR